MICPRGEVDVGDTDSGVSEKGDKKTDGEVDDDDDDDDDDSRMEEEIKRNR